MSLPTLLLALAGTPATAETEVPFITTPDHVTLAMLEIAAVGAADHLIDLGSGDGRIVITAAKRFGASGLGVEIVPDLVRRSRASAIAAGLAERVEFREQDLFTTELSRATVITMYLLPELNLQLRPRLLALAPGTRIVSHDWDMGDWAPERTLTLAVPDKSVGREKSSRVHLWVVPARIDGLWCSGGDGLRISQRFQQVSAVLERPGGAAPVLVFDARVEGERLQAKQPHLLAFQIVPGALRVLQAGGAAAGIKGREFVPAAAGRCG